MSRFRILLLALVALSLSALLTLFLYRQVVSRISGRKADADSFQIVVAAERIPFGTLLEARHLRLAPWAEEVPLQGSFATVEQAVGRGVIVSMLANEPVLESKLAPEEAGAGLTTVIPAGMRAVSVKVDEVIGVAGFVLPGTRVDVIVTGSPDARTAGEISKMVLENVEVLAAGQNVERDAQGTPQDVQVVTLLVAPEDAQKLALASVDARIQLALRNPLDMEYTDPEAVHRSALYSKPASKQPEVVQEAPVRRVARRRPAPPRPAPPKKYEVEVIQGTERQTMTFEEKKQSGE
jgi:pilus assembly protein CpaB